jgi:uncharacterized protein
MELADFVISKRDQIIELAAKHGAHNVRVFGSVARRQADESSDIDFLVTLNPEFSLIDHVRLEESLRNLLGRRVDVISDRSLSRQRFSERVLKEATPL